MPYTGDPKHNDTMEKPDHDAPVSNDEKVAALANARFSSLSHDRPGDLMGGAKSTSFALRGRPEPLKIEGSNSFKNNPFLQNQK